MNQKLANSSKPGNEHKEFVLGWFGRPVAKMNYDGINLEFDYESGWMIPLESYARKPGKYPMFMRYFLPSSLTAQNNVDNIDKIMALYFDKQERFMGNVVVTESDDRVRELGTERLYGKLSRFNSNQDIFTGGQNNIALMTRKMMAEIDDVIVEKRLTQISGNQTKVPVFLDDAGELHIAQGLPTTHIIKYAGSMSDPDRIRGAAEWIGMSLIRAGGVNSAEFSLIEMSDEKGSTLNYLTERFDVPDNEEDPRMLFCEEFGSALGMNPGYSDQATLNDAIKGVNDISTSINADMNHLFKQVVANAILENADFHIRNLSVIKTAEPNLMKFRSVKLSPAYDVMRTRDFMHKPIPSNQRECMRMSFDTEEFDTIQFNDPTMDEFKQVGRAMGIIDSKIEELVHSIAKGMYEGAFRIEGSLPEVFDRYECAKTHVLETCAVVKRNALDLVPSLKDEVDLTPTESFPKRVRP
jgi:hypothetical protein